MLKFKKFTAILMSTLTLSGVVVGSIYTITNNSKNIKADEVSEIKPAEDKIIESDAIRKRTWWGTSVEENIIVRKGKSLTVDDLMQKFKPGVVLPEGSKLEITKVSNVYADAAVEAKMTLKTGESQISKFIVHHEDPYTGSGGSAGVPGTMSADYIPVGQDLSIVQGDAVQYIDVSDAIINKADMPEGTTYSFKNKLVTNEVGDKTMDVIVAYPDESTDEIRIIVHVSRPGGFGFYFDYRDKIVFPAKGNDITTYVGEPIDASEGISNKDEMPNAPTTPTYQWEKEPDWNTPGKQKANILVFYPDKAGANRVTINVDVLQRDNQKYKLQGNTIITKVGTSLESKEGIKNNSELPEGTVYEWLDNEPDWNTPWKVFDHKVKVTYPDKTTAEETAKIIVYGMFEGQDIYVDQNAKADIIKGIKDADKYSDIIKDIKFEWEKEPDTSKGGVFPAKINVTYPDAWGNVSYILNINVHVTIPWAEIGPSTPIEKPDTSIPWTPLEPSIPTEKPNVEKPTTDAKPKVDKVTPKELPKTGNKTVNLVGLGLGFIAMSIISMLAIKPKRKDNKN